MRKITILIALFIGVMLGCQNSDLELVPTENLQSNDPFIPLRETFDFTYNGKTYSSPFYMENDTLMILEDEEVAAVYNRLQELPELATYVASNGDYNTLRQGRKALLIPPVAIPHLDAYGMNDMISSFTAGAHNLMYSSNGEGITFFRNPDYKAQSITFTVNGLTSVESGYYYYCKVRNFHDYKVKKGINWNDRISSIKTFE